MNSGWPEPHGSTTSQNSVWSCVGCDADNKPLRSYLVHETSVEIRAILSVYEEYTVLAFRYTANVKNTFQGCSLSPPSKFITTQHQDDDAPQDARFRRSTTICGRKSGRTSSTTEDIRAYYPLIITGISLGGGLACLSFIDIRAVGEFNNIEAIIFGRPRVGNKKRANFFNSEAEATRIYIYKDPINFLPRCLTPICNYSPVVKPVVCHQNRQECDFKNQEKRTTPSPRVC
jgi:hypothetical protein